MKRTHSVKATRLATILALLILHGCGGGGGGSGSTTSVIEGNVSAAESQRTGRGSVLGILVSVRDTEAATETDENGFFRLEGGFAGPVMVDFTMPGVGSAAVGVDVPEGDTVVLEDVAVDVDSGEAVPTGVVVMDDDGRNLPLDDDDGSDAASTPVEDAVTPDSNSGISPVAASNDTGDNDGVSGAPVVAGSSSGIDTGNAGAGTVVIGPDTNVVVGESSIAGGGGFSGAATDAGGGTPTIPGGGDADPAPPQGPSQVDVLDEVPGDNNTDDTPQSVGSGAGFDGAGSGTSEASIGGGGFVSTLGN